MSDKPAKTDEELRKDLSVAQEAYDRSKTYYNAVGVQKAKSQLNTRFALRRGALTLVQGDQGNHDLSDIEIMGKALSEIFRAIHNMKTDDDIPGTLLYCHQVSKHALVATERMNE